MAGNKITKKVRFLPYLPYGYCSRLAITMEGKNNPFAAVFRSFDDPEGLVAQSDQYRKAALKRTRLLFQKGYAKDSKCSCGNPTRERSFGHLTKLGLAVLIEALDEAINCGCGAVIDCRLDIDEMVRPMVAAGSHITNFLLD